MRWDNLSTTSRWAQSRESATAIMTTTPLLRLDLRVYDGHEVKFYKLTQLGFWLGYSGFGAAGRFGLEDPQK
jgi:hypothetical protein